MEKPVKSSTTEILTTTKKAPFLTSMPHQPSTAVAHFSRRAAVWVCVGCRYFPRFIALTLRLPRSTGRIYIASGNSPFFYCLDEQTGEALWIYKLGHRVEEATLYIYRDKVSAIAADGYLHAIE